MILDRAPAMGFMLSALLAAASLLASSACGSSSGGGDTAPVILSDVPEVISTAFCQHMDRCSGGALFDILGIVDCHGFLVASSEDHQLPLWRQALVDGTLAYDGDAVRGCAAALRSAACDATMESIPACGGVFVGQVAEGGACRFREECAGDSSCSFSDDTCAGTCTARAAAGEHCDQLVHCQAGSSCWEDVCVKEALTGEACGGGVAPRCVGNQICVGDDREAGAAGVCQTQEQYFVAAEGQPCDLDVGPACAPGLSCVLVSVDPGGQGKTFECAAKAALGGDCGRGYPNPCQGSQYCDVDASGGALTGTCRDLPGEGQACGGGFFGGRCGAGLVCSGDDLCVTRARLGESCVDDDQCYSEVCEGGACVEPQCDN